MLIGLNGFPQILNPFFCFGFIRVNPFKSDLIRVSLLLIFTCSTPVFRRWFVATSGRRPMNKKNRTISIR
jgi:uncharacterized protein with ParB-like and HNH nuclease domain